jgi:hypothetical protein
MLDEHSSLDALQVTRDIDHPCSPVDARSPGPARDAVAHVRCAWLRGDGHGGLRFGDDDHSLVAMAISCLVKAVAGDRVRAVLDAGTWYVTDILRRTDGSAPLDIDAGNNTLNLSASRLCLGAEDLHLSAKNWSTTAAHVNQQLGREVTHVEQRYVRAGSSAIDVDTTAVTRAAHIVSHASQALVLRGKAASLGAEGLLRIDGAQVHMG